jgi:hypothetical protein
MGTTLERATEIRPFNIEVAEDLMTPRERRSS